MSESRVLNQLQLIEEGAHQGEDVVTLLRRCLTLAGDTGSSELRTWVERELNGYDGESELPEYRKPAAPIFMDEAGMSRLTKHILMPIHLFPSEAWRQMSDGPELRQPLRELQAHMESARRGGHASIDLAPPGIEYLLPLVNEKVRRSHPGAGYIERFYWSVPIEANDALLDVIRTKIVALVSDIRSATNHTDSEPTPEKVNELTNSVIYGNVTVNNFHNDGPVAIAGRDLQTAHKESRARTIMFWVGGMATVAGTVFVALQIFNVI